MNNNRGEEVEKKCGLACQKKKKKESPQPPHPPHPPPQKSKSPERKSFRPFSRIYITASWIINMHAYPNPPLLQANSSSCSCHETNAQLPETRSFSINIIPSAVCCYIHTYVCMYGVRRGLKNRLIPFFFDSSKIK